MPYCTTNGSDLKRIYLFELLSARRKDGIKCILSIGNWNKSVSDYAEKTIYEIQAQEKKEFYVY